MKLLTINEWSSKKQRNLEVKNGDAKKHTFEIWEDGKPLYKCYDDDSNYYVDGNATYDDIVQFLKSGEYEKI